jgi:hypothetical protein
MHGIGLFDLNRDVLAKLYDKFGEDNGSLRFPSTVHGVMDLLDMLSVEDHAG